MSTGQTGLCPGKHVLNCWEFRAIQLVLANGLADLFVVSCSMCHSTASGLASLHLRRYLRYLGQKRGDVKYSRLHIMQSLRNQEGTMRKRRQDKPTTKELGNACSGCAGKYRNEAA